jgi:hypothetical protein
MRWKYREPVIKIWNLNFAISPKQCGVCRDSILFECVYRKINRGVDGLHACYCNKFMNDEGHYWHCNKCHALYLLKQEAA